MITPEQTRQRVVEMLRADAKKTRARLTPLDWLKELGVELFLLAAWGLLELDKRLR